jgi:amino acid adenylation domain-containing protein
MVLAQGPLLRLKLLRESAQRNVLVLSVHHSVFDGWSGGVLVRELAALYGAYRAGTPTPLAELAVQYADYAVWQRQWLQGEALERQLSYWRERLAGAAPSLELPTDRPRPPVASYRGARWSCVLPAALHQSLAALSRREGVTLFMTLLAGFKVLLSRYSGQQDVVIGSPVANRGLPELEGMIGLFVNTLVLRSELDPKCSFRELLGQVRETCLGAYAHQDLPFERLVEELKPPRDTSRNPLFQVMFALQNMELPALKLTGLAIAPLDFDREAAQVDLTLYMHESAAGLHATFEYSTDLFERGTIERLGGHLRTVLEAAAARPETALAALPLLDEAERTRVLEEFNDTRRQYPRDATLPQLFAASVAAQGNRVAVSMGKEELSYAQLDARSNRLARHLRALGVERDQLVGLCVERGVDLLVAMLGIWKAGGAYVPLDPGFPMDRLAYMLEDSGARVLVTEAALANELLRGSQVAAVRLDADRAAIEERSADSLPPAAGPHDRAYVIYTSGSTGRPKGVEIEHRALVNFLWSMREAPGLTAEDVLAAVTTMSFDIAGLELFLPLLTGARVELVSREAAVDPAALAQVLRSCGATVMQATPATWRMLIESGWAGNRSLKVLCGGEALGRDLVQRLLPLCGELWNMYGPTETTIWSSLARIESADDVTIGRPIANTQLYVLDAQRQPVPRGVVGELWIGGDGVARSYLKREELTAERFCANPFHAGRMYRTGDLARHVGDGRLECLGRIDHQVKLRGYRIELGEIEAVLGEHPQVAECAVIVTGDEANRRLVGYVVGDGDASSYREHLRARLPEYMVPAQFVALAELPKTPNNKIDRKALPALAPSESESAARYVAPRTPTEEAVATAYGEVLSVDRVGIEDNFFELGGHSLLATRAIARLQLVLDVQLPVRAVFDAPTVEALSQHIDTLRWLARRSATVTAGDDREEVLL